MNVPKRVDQLLEMLLHEPEDVFLNYALGIEYVSSTNNIQAEFQFKKVLQLNPNHVATYYQLGKLLETQSKNTDALNYYTIGLEKAKQAKDNKAINEFGEAIFMLE